MIAGVTNLRRSAWLGINERSACDGLPRATEVVLRAATVEMANWLRHKAPAPAYYVLVK